MDQHYEKEDKALDRRPHWREVRLCVCALEAANLRVLQIRFAGKVASAARVLSDLVPLLPSFAMDYVFEPERIP